MQPVNDLYFVKNEARIRLECFGTGNLQWSSSTGLQVLSDTSGNIYQLYDHTRDALTLVIQNFTNIAIATYTCMTNLTDAHNSPITVSILITSCKWRERENNFYQLRCYSRPQLIPLSSSSLKFSMHYPIAPPHWKLEYLHLLLTRQLCSGTMKEDP